MKCPKCGSYDVICIYSHKCECYGCQNSFNPKEIRYQARLDKVLSKFKRGIENKDYYQIRHNGYLFIDYLVGDGYFDIHQGGTQFKISLDTVESLLRDLERGNKYE